jgi:allantoinase
VVATAARVRKIPLHDLSRWLASAPARLAGLGRSKGAIAPGLDADFAIWDPDQVTVVDAAALYHRHPVTPYDGARLRGRVVTTILRGQVVFDDGKRLNGVHGRIL